MLSKMKSAAGRRPARRSGVAGERATLKLARREVSTVEEVRAYRGRLEAWAGCLAPGNSVERYLLERAVSLSWQLDRAERSGLVPTGPHSLAAEAGGPIPPAVAEDDRTARRLLRHQLACGRALLRTLGAFARMRDLRVAAPVEKPEVPVDSDKVAPAIARAPEMTPPAPPRRPRVGVPGARESGWPRERPTSKVARPAEGPKSRPDGRSFAEPDAPRRRVGGYAVPMDPCIPVSCADKIPVRLRRARAAGTIG